jgi:hypothetical protein
VLRKIRKEQKRLAAGFNYEPPTFYERNAAVEDRPEVPLCRYATPRAAPPPVERVVVPSLPVQEAELVGV